jgi:phage antirepressor YoqD-like protein
VPISLIAKDYGYGAEAFNRLLFGLGVQFKLNGTWVLYQKHAGNGYTRTQTFFSGNRTLDIRTYWTMRGWRFIYETLKKHNILPHTEPNVYAGAVEGVI